MSSDAPADIHIAIDISPPFEITPRGTTYPAILDGPYSEEFLIEGQELQYYRRVIKARFPDRPLFVDFSFNSDITTIVHVWAEAINDNVESANIDHVAIDIDTDAKPSRSLSRCSIL